MTVAELMTTLATMDPSLQVMVVDQIGPQIVSGPYLSTITEQNADDCGDCEGRVGEQIVILYV
jgi:hypothetical protein